MLGMHRSGTSLVSGLLAHLGVSGPRTLMRPTGDNLRGYWESELFAGFHDRLLGSAMTSWDGWTPVRPVWWDSEPAAACAAEFRDLLEREFDTAPLFVVKDPRMCRIVPFWVRNLRAAGVEPAAILTLRSPSEVAGSLASRNGFAREQSLLLWLRHMLDAEHDTRTIRRSVVRYRDLLQGWRGQVDRVGAELGIEWPSRSAAVADAIDDFVRPELCHHSAGLEAIGVEPPLSDWVAGAAEALDALVNPGLQPDVATGRLDEIRRQLDGAASQFGGWQEAALHHLRERTARLEAEREALSRERARLEDATRGLRDVIHTLEAERAGLLQNTADLERDNRELAHGISEARHEMTAARSELEAVLASLSWRLTAPLRALARPLMRRRSGHSRPPGTTPRRD